MNVVTWESLAAPSVVIFLPQLFLQTVGQLHTVDIQPVVHAIADGSDGEVEQAGHGADLDEAELDYGVVAVQQLDLDSPHLTSRPGEVRLVIETDQGGLRGEQDHLLSDLLNQPGLEDQHVPLGLLGLPEDHPHEAPPVAQLTELGLLQAEGTGRHELQFVVFSNHREPRLSLLECVASSGGMVLHTQSSVE